MLSLVLAASNAPSIYRDRRAWLAIYESQLTDGVPAPNQLQAETIDVVDAHIGRVAAAHQTLRDRLLAVRPDALVILGYDDGTAFSGVQTPQFCTFTGETMTGSTALPALGERTEDHQVTLNCAPDIAWEIHRELIDREFDVNYMAVQNPQGRPDQAASSAFTRPAAAWLAGLNLPIIPIFINCMVEPTPSGERCLAFGAALGEIIDGLPQSVAILAMGGLSHDPNGARAGWVDERLDNSVLDQLRRGRVERLGQMFSLDSDALRGGTGQIRTWLAAAAAAQGRNGKATIVDYVPSYRAITGLGFAYWTL